ncbi:Membrane-spanning 4-domains subfamily A member 18, partial [Galemys pyrenaicus]
IRPRPALSIPLAQQKAGVPPSALDSLGLRAHEHHPWSFTKCPGTSPPQSGDTDPTLLPHRDLSSPQVIQILIGLTHIFFAIKPSWYYSQSVTARSGYPVWGGVSVNGSIGMNVVSATVSLTGVTVILVDMFRYQYYAVSLANSLLPFALLEFCLTCVVSHLGCQAVCWDRYVVSSGLHSRSQSMLLGAEGDLSVGRS